MRTRTLVSSTLAVAALSAAFVFLTAARHNSRAVERIDFDRISRSTSPAFDARLAPVSDAGVKDFRIPIKDATIEISKGVTYQGWTFGGTVPGQIGRAHV